MFNKRQEDTEKAVKLLIDNGIYCQNEIFNRLYPRFPGHYNTLRRIIDRIKNDVT